jgi:PilZ domain
MQHFQFPIKRTLMVAMLEFANFSVFTRVTHMRERRKNFRVEWNSAAKIYDCKGHFAGPCIVSNFSNGGAKIVGVKPDTFPNNFILRISPNGRAHKCRVVWRTKDSLGVKFTGSVKETREAEIASAAKGAWQKALERV